MKFTPGRMLTWAIASTVMTGALADEVMHQDKITASVESEMQAMDTNQDGRISRAEYLAGAKQMFMSLDGDQDGRVTAVEMDAAQKVVKAAEASHGTEDQRGTAEMSAKNKAKVVDRNGDGVLTAKEHEAGAQQMFDNMDADNDGFLSAAEIMAGRAKLMAAEER